MPPPTLRSPIWARVIGTNPRPGNQLWASGLLQTVRSARAPFRELVFMNARQKRPKTAFDQYLSILFLETANFRRQLYELNKLRYQVRQAELAARNRAQAHAAGTRTSDRPRLAQRHPRNTPPRAEQQDVTFRVRCYAPRTGDGARMANKTPAPRALAAIKAGP